MNEAAMPFPMQMVPLAFPQYAPLPFGLNVGVNAPVMDMANSPLASSAAMPHGSYWPPSPRVMVDSKVAPPYPVVVDDNDELARVGDWGRGEEGGGEE